MSCPRLLAVLVVVLLAVPAGLARGASIYSQVLKAYQVHGSVPACEFTAPQLERALKAIDTYGAQYFQDFSTAIQDALSARASGGCAPKPAQPSPPAHGATGAGAPGGSAGVSGAGAPSATAALAPVGASTASSPPLPLLILAAFAAAAAMIGSLAALARWRGWSPGWAASWGHAWGEAGFRTESRWLEFTDWLRSGSL